MMSSVGGVVITSFMTTLIPHTPEQGQCTTRQHGEQDETIINFLQWISRSNYNNKFSWPGPYPAPQGVVLHNLLRLRWDHNHLSTSYEYRLRDVITKNVYWWIDRRTKGNSHKFYCSKTVPFHLYFLSTPPVARIHWLVEPVLEISQILN